MFIQKQLHQKLNEHRFKTLQNKTNIWIYYANNYIVERI